MKLLAEISAGELIDKITILEIKRDQISDAGKRINIEREYAALTSVLNQIPPSDALVELRGSLKQVNTRLWRIEDDIRAHERTKDFDAAFVALARSVYRENDQRATFKREINMLLQSDLVEEKSYETY